MLESCRVRLALSRLPLFSILRIAARTSAGSMSEIGRLPIEPLSRESRYSLRVAVAGAQPFSPSRRRFAQYSAAIALNVSAASMRFRILSRCFSREGSLPLPSRARASSRRLRASLRLTAGYAPRASSFSFPSKRYLNRQSLPPAGVMRRNMPLSSLSLVAFGPGLACRIATSVSGICERAFAVLIPPWPGVLHRLSTDTPSIIPPACCDRGRKRANRCEPIVRKYQAFWGLV